MKRVRNFMNEQQNLNKSMVFKMVLIVMCIVIKHLMKVLFANLSIH